MNKQRFTWPSKTSLYDGTAFTQNSRLTPAQDCIEAVLIADLDDIFPTREWIDIQAEGYTLRGCEYSRLNAVFHSESFDIDASPWKHGDYLEFNWGYEELQKSRNKWVFEFELV